MTESRKIWKLAGRCAQYYCALVLAGILLFFAALAAEAAATKPDLLLDAPALCGDGILAADVGAAVDSSGKPLVPVSPAPENRVMLNSGNAVIPVRTPLPRVPRMELNVDVSGLLQPPPACLTPEQARENLPPNPARTR